MCSEYFEVTPVDANDESKGYNVMAWSEGDVFTTIATSPSEIFADKIASNLNSVYNQAARIAGKSVDFFTGMPVTEKSVNKTA